MSNLQKIINVTNAKPQGGGEYLGHCVAHDDRTPSLSITEKEGKILLNCHAGCSGESVISELQKLNAWPQKNKDSSGTFITALPPKSKKRKKELNIGEVVPEKPLIERYFSYRGIKNINEFFTEIENSFETRKVGKDLVISALLKDWSTGEITAIQNTHISKEAQNIKVDGKNKKKIHGKLENNFLLLGNTISDEVHICEGVETGVAIYSQIRKPVIISFGVQNLSKVKIPKNVKSVHFWADNDINKTGEKGAIKAIDQIKDRFEVYLHLPEIIDNKNTDWLDVLVHSPQKMKESFDSPQVFGWEKPRYIENKLPKVPKLTREICPDILFDFCEDESNRSGAPIEYFFTPLVTSLSVMTSRSFKVQPKLNDSTWIDSPLIWGANVGLPGSMKTYSLNRGGIDFLRSIDKINIEKDKSQLSSYHQRRKIIEERINVITKEFSKGKVNTDKQIELEDLNEELKNLTYKLKQIVINDSTPESLIHRLSKTNEPVLFFNDELTNLLGSFNSDNKGALRPILLEGWNGTNSYFKETISRGSETIDLLAIAVLGGIQPSKFLPILDEISKGKNDDGFLQRIQLITYPNQTKPLRQDVAPNFDLYRKIETIFHKLQQTENVLGENFITLKFNNEAQETRNQLTSWIDDIVFESNTHDTLKTYVSKFPRLFNAASAIYEICLADSPECLTFITKPNAEKAFNLCKFVLEHIKKLLDINIKPENQSSFTIAQKIQEGSIENGSSVRDIYRHNWAGLKKDAVFSGLKLLEEYNWLKIEKTSPTTGRPSEYIRLNPVLLREGCSNFIKL